MNLKEVMSQQYFVIVGDTLNEEKFAFKIKNKMKEYGYVVSCAGKELSSINDVCGPIDVIDLCIHPAKGLKLIQECTRPFKCIVIQPGAESCELKAYLEEENLPYIESCLLVGLEKYKGDCHMESRQSSR